MTLDEPIAMIGYAACPILELIGFIILWKYLRQVGKRITA